MIAFNRDDSPSNNFDDNLNKLEKILKQIYDDELNHYLNTSEEDDDVNSNLSELLELVYFHLYTQNYKNINLSITKNKNNSLQIYINSLE
jgi:hypothetical protein|tara:strand:+ start:127 stop:396 length:270 start_codon:yes stop_codon:yes gene_type:complete